MEAFNLKFTFLLLLTFWLPLASLATRLPVQRRENAKGFSVDAFVNAGNFMYIINITLGGQEFPVSIDTGSTDLWVVPPAPISDANFTDIQVNETYGKGSIFGNVSFAPFTIGPYSVPSQAFVNASKLVEQDAITLSGAYGLIGLSFETSALNLEVYNVTKNATLGRSALGNIFAQNLTMPNYISIHLSRSDDMENIHGGTFLISEDQPGFEHVKDMPRLQRFSPKDNLLPRWAVELDGVDVNGKQLALNSSVKHAPDGKAIAVLDSGASLAQVPPAVADLIYGSIPDAFFVEDESIWIVPCTSYSNVTFTFAGQQYAIHPLDLTLINNQTFDDGSLGTYCTSGFSPVTLGDSFTAGFDMLLGDSFLRNVYASFDYGEIDKNGKMVGDPYVQLLSTTDKDNAVGEFQKHRAETLKNFPPQVSMEELRQIFSDEGEDEDEDSDSVAAQGSLTASDSASDMSTLVDRLNQYGPVVVVLLAGNLLVGVILLLIGLAACVRRGGRTRKEYTTVPTGYREADKDTASHEHAPLNQKYSD